MPSVDPATQHRHVVRVNGPFIRYCCGCLNARDTLSGWLKSVEKCDAHRAEAKDAAELDGRYYKSIGAMDPDAPGRYLAELGEMLGPLPGPPHEGAVALEVGPGISPYAGELIRLGWRYECLETSGFAVEMMNRAHGLALEPRDAETWVSSDPAPSLILAPHCLEHFVDGPGTLARLAAGLAPGGELWLIVPNDEDPLNPDHLWFPNVEAIRNRIHAHGLTLIALNTRRRIERETFIYARASKPLDAKPHILPVEYPGLAGKSWVSPGELAFLDEMLPRDGVIIEVGTASGVTAAMLAERRPGARIICVDTFATSGDQDANQEPSRRADWEANRRPNMELFTDDFYRLVLGGSLKADAVIVDGDHSYRGVSRDLDAAEMCLAPGGRVFCHDYGDPHHREVQSAVDDFCALFGYVPECDRFAFRVLRRG